MSYPQLYIWGIENIVFTGMAKCLYADEIVCCVVTFHTKCYFFHYITSSTPNKTTGNGFLIQRVDDLNIQSVDLVNIPGFKVEIVDRQHIIVHDILRSSSQFYITPKELWFQGA